MPLKTLIGMLEKEFLMVPVMKVSMPLIFLYLGVSLNLVPWTSKCLDNLAPDVSHDLGN